MRSRGVMLIVVGLCLGAACVSAAFGSTKRLRFDLGNPLVKRTESVHLREGFKYDFVLRVEPAHWDNGGLYKSVPIWMNLADPRERYGDKVIIPTHRGQGRVSFWFEPQHDGNYVIQAGTLAPLA